VVWPIVRDCLIARPYGQATGNETRTRTRNTIKATNNQPLQSFVTIERHNAIVMIQTTQLGYYKQRHRYIANNASVIVQTTQLGYCKQRKRYRVYNASVVSLSPPLRHNVIVISRSGRQAFVMFRNISSAYHSHKPGLSVQAYYSTGVLLCGYAGCVIQRYRHMIICGYAQRGIKR